MGKVSGWDWCFIAPSERTLPFFCHVDDVKMGGTKNNLKPMWDFFLKQVDLEELTPLLDQVYLWCTQREGKPNPKTAQENKNMFKSLISASTIKQLPGWERSHAEITASYSLLPPYRRGGEKSEWASWSAFHGTGASSTYTSRP